MRKISGIISIALASSCLLSICGCGNRGRNTDSSVPVDDMEFIVYEELNGMYNYDHHTDLPESVRYLDGSRKLKKSYTLEEAQERYAVKLAHSTVICSECDSYVMTCRFCCIDYDANIYSCINSFKLTDQEDFTFPLELKDTEYRSLSEYWKAYSKTEEKYRDANINEKISHPEIVEKTDEYIFSCISCPDASYSEYDIYCYAGLVGNRVYTLNLSTYTRGLTENEKQHYIDFGKHIFGHLEPDDGKEPYLYDKMLRVAFFGDKHLTSFNMLSYVNQFYSKEKSEVSIFGVEILIDPDESEISALFKNRKTEGEITTDDTDLYIRKILFTYKDVTYICMFSKNINKTFESGEDMVKYLEFKGAIA